MNHKRANQSLTIWSGLASSMGGLTVILTVLLRQSGVETSQEEVGAILGGLVSAVTGIVAIYGRVRANTIISRKP